MMDRVSISFSAQSSQSTCYRALLLPGPSITAIGVQELGLAVEALSGYSHTPHSSIVDIVLIQITQRIAIISIFKQQ